MATVKKSDTAPGALFGKALTKSEKEKRMTASIPSQYQKFLPPSKQAIGAATRANAANRQQAQPTAKARPSTIAPLKPMSIVPDYKKPVSKAAPVAKPAAPAAPASPSDSMSAPEVKTQPKSSDGLTTTQKAMLSNYEKYRRNMEREPEVKSNASTEKSNVFQRIGDRMKKRQIARAEGKNVFQRIGERIKQRQLARANRGVGSPMKNALQLPQMKKYAKGGMIEKEGMKPKGKMDRKKAFLEMIAKLKAKKK